MGSPQKMRRGEILKNFAQSRRIRPENAKKEGEKRNVSASIDERILGIAFHHANLKIYIIRTMSSLAHMVGSRGKRRRWDVGKLNK